MTFFTGQTMTANRTGMIKREKPLHIGDICTVSEVWDSAGPGLKYALLSLLVDHEDGRRCVVVDLWAFKHLEIGKSYPTRYRIYNTYEQALIVTMSRGV